MLLKPLDGSSQTRRGATSREIHLQSTHKGLPTCHVLLRHVQVVWCFLSCLNTSVLVLMSWGWVEGEHVKCFTTLDPSVGYRALPCPVFHCCSQMMSYVPSCESPQNLLPWLVPWGSEPQAAPSAQPLLQWLQHPENIRVDGKAEGHPVRKRGDLRLTRLPWPPGLQSPVFLAVLEFARIWGNCFQLQETMCGILQLVT